MARRVAGLAGVLFAVALFSAAQNLIGNGRFDTDLNGWVQTGDVNGTAAWSSLDAGGSAVSGSAALTSTHATNGALVTQLTQCVPVAAGVEYVLSARVQFAAGETTTGWAETVVYWDSGPGCTNYITGSALLTDKASPGTWIADAENFTAPAGAVSALVQLGIDKIEAGGMLSAWFDDVSLAPASAPAETLVGYITVVGSVHGGFGSNFKTAVQLLNPGFSPISGRLVFHPAGVSGSASDPSIGYSLAPAQTFSWDDIIGSMGQSGLGSMDVFVSGDTPPVVVTRIFNDAGDQGTSGFTEPLIPPAPLGGPGVSVTGFLVGPADVDRFRFNVGLRTLGGPVSVSVDVRDQSGASIHTVTHSYPANYFVQSTVADFLGGFVLPSGASLRITFSGGGLIVYGATADNVTNDPSAQFMPYLFAVA
jgi:hypothetical protein